MATFNEYIRELVEQEEENLKREYQEKLDAEKRNKAAFTDLLNDLTQKGLVLFYFILFIFDFFFSFFNYKS